MKKIASILLVAAGVLSVFYSSACKSMPSEDLKKSIEVTDIETKWVSKYYQPLPPRLILVPALSFRIKNLGQKPLTYINFNAIFKFKDDAENLGDHFMAAIRGKGVNPGEKSEIILLKSNFGVEGKNLDSFKDTFEWKPTEVKLFAQSKGSPPVLLGQWNVSRTIDFKPPEPIEIKKDETVKTQ